jgi:hypothetical protein
VGFFQVFQEEIHTVLYKQFGRVVHGHPFSYHWGFTTFFYHGYKITAVPPGKHPTSSATIGCILSIGLWLRRKEDHLREHDRRRESAQARDPGFPARRRNSGRRVRWLDEVEGGHELEKAMDMGCDDLKLDASLPIEKRGVCRACEECLVSKID